MQCYTCLCQSMLSFPHAGLTTYVELADHMKDKPYMCVNPSYLQRCTDTQLDLLLASGLLHNSFLQDNQASKRTNVTAQTCSAQPMVVPAAAVVQAIDSLCHLPKVFTCMLLCKHSESLGIFADDIEAFCITFVTSNLQAVLCKTPCHH